MQENYLFNLINRILKIQDLDFNKSVLEDD